MAGRNKFLAALAGMVAAVGLMATGAQASVQVYAGTGTTAVNSWLSVASGSGTSCTAPCVENASATVSGSPPTYTLPLSIDTGLKLNIASGMILNTGTLSGTLAATITNAQLANNAGNGKTITLSNFAPDVTAFGFWLGTYTTVTYATDIKISFFDGTNTTTVIVPASAGCAGTYGEGSCTAGATALTSTAAEFIGITGFDFGPSATITIAGVTGLRYVTGDYLEATDTPEPASLALLGAGLVGLGIARRRKSA